MELATAYIDTALSSEVQTAMVQAPYCVAPTAMQHFRVFLLKKLRLVLTSTKSLFIKIGKQANSDRTCLSVF